VGGCVPDSTTTLFEHLPLTSPRKPHPPNRPSYRPKGRRFHKLNGSYIFSWGELVDTTVSDMNEVKDGGG